MSKLQTKQQKKNGPDVSSDAVTDVEPTSVVTCCVRNTFLVFGKTNSASVKQRSLSCPSSR